MEIIVRDYTKRIKNTYILNKISLEFMGGNIYGITGQNGSGKTMLLRAISGLIHPTEGKVFINGKELFKEVDFPSLQIIGEALIDGLLEYANRYGKPQRIVVNNLNVLFLVLNFISQYDIDYFEDEITLEIEGAIMDAFGLETADEAFNDPFIQELLEQLDGKSEEEIEENINEILANMELLN